MQIKHEVQKEILKNLIYLEKARFAELNTTDFTNDHFTFHLKRLVEGGLIEKNDDYYSLTSEGIEVASRLDLYSMSFVSQPKVGVILIVFEDLAEVVTESELKKKKLLVGKRLHNPLMDKVGFYTEKIRAGERFQMTIDRCLINEAGINAEKSEYIGVYRILRKDSKGVVLADIVLNYFLIRSFSGSYSESTAKAENFLTTYGELYERDDIPDLFQSEMDSVKGYILERKVFAQEILAGEKW